MMESSSTVSIKPLLDLSSEFTNLCRPLVEKLSLRFVRFVRIYADGRLSFLTDRPEVVSWYFDEALYKYGINEKTVEYYQSGFVLTDSLPKSDELLDKITNPLAEIFQIGSELFLYDKHQSHCSVLEIGLPRHFSDANQWLMKHYDFVAKFFQYTILNTPLLTLIEKFAFSLPESNPNAFPLLNIVSNINNLNIHKLAPRELECLFWLKHGKTCPEIALILQLSARTVEMYINNLRRKLGVYTFFQLGELLGQYQSHFKVLFDEFSRQY